MRVLTPPYACHPIDKRKRSPFRALRPPRPSTNHWYIVLPRVSLTHPAYPPDNPYHLSPAHSPSSTFQAQTHTRSDCTQEWSCLRDQLRRSPRRRGRPRAGHFNWRREWCWCEKELVGRRTRGRTSDQGQGHLGERRRLQ